MVPRWHGSSACLRQVLPALAEALPRRQVAVDLLHLVAEALRSGGGAAVRRACLDPALLRRLRGAAGLGAYMERLHPLVLDCLRGQQWAPAAAAQGTASGDGPASVAQVCDMAAVWAPGRAVPGHAAPALMGAGCGCR
jgi:hypothetical protein